jgi:hypothetical protein
MNGKRNRWSVTYEIVTPESAEQGDAEERGYISQGVTLREAITDLFSTRTSQCEGVTAIEANDSDAARARWITVYNGDEYLTGARENRSLHMPDNLTSASRARLVRLLERGQW